MLWNIASVSVHKWTVICLRHKGVQLSCYAHISAQSKSHVTVEAMQTIDEIDLRNELDRGESATRVEYELYK